MENIYENTIVITDRKLVSGDFISQIRKAVSLHPYALILREKDLNDDEYTELSVKVKKICDENYVRFFFHSRADLAIKHGYKNIHLSIPALKEIADTGKLSFFNSVSVSCHSEEDVRFSEKCGATQIVLGTIFETDCKKGLKRKGTEFVRKICQITDLPVYAIGGINPDNLENVMKSGARGGCMMSGFMKM